MSHPGAYLSWVKLLLVAVVFLVWVRMADWINRDSMKIGEQTDLIPEIWNPINAGTFLLGFLVAISVPIFVAGFSIYLICAWAPFLTYFFLRRAKIKAQPRILDQVRTKPGETPPAALLPQDEGAAIEFSPAGGDTKEQQVNLIRARQSEGFPAFKNLINDVVSKRADVVLLDYTRDRVDCRIQVDGAWHAMPPLDRVSGDALLFSAKSLAGLDTSRAARKTRWSIRNQNRNRKSQPGTDDPGSAHRRTRADEDSAESQRLFDTGAVGNVSGNGCQHQTEFEQTGFGNHFRAAPGWTDDFLAGSTGNYRPFDAGLCGNCRKR